MPAISHGAQTMHSANCGELHSHGYALGVGLRADIFFYFSQVYMSRSGVAVRVTNDGEAHRYRSGGDYETRRGREATRITSDNYFLKPAGYLKKMHHTWLNDKRILKREILPCAPAQLTDACKGEY